MFRTIKSIKNGVNDLIDKHPKITRFYRKGVGNRLLSVLLSISILAVCVADYAWVGYSFSQGEYIIGGIGILLGMACIALLAKYLMVFAVIAFKTVKLGIKYRVQNISDYIDSVTEEEKKERDDGDLEDFKPHGIIDTAVFILEMFFFLVSTLGFLVIPFVANGLF